MSQSLKKAVTLIGIVAIGFATFGLGTIILGPAAFSIGEALAYTGFGTLFSFGVSLVSIGSAPKPPSIDQTGANQRGAPYADPNALAVFVFGTTTVPLAIVYEEQTEPRMSGQA